MSFRNLTLIECFYHLEKNAADDIFLRQPFGSQWEEYSYKEAGIMARKLASYINSLGLKPKSHIGLISKNCREWIISDLAIMMSGHTSVPLYATLTAESLSEIIDLGDIDLLIIGKLESWEEMKSGVKNDLPCIKFPHYSGFSMVDKGKSWEEIMKEFDPKKDQYIPDDDDIWTIVFTSGTTGTPKGVMHSYKLLKNVSEVSGEFNSLKLEERNNRYFSYLALNHIAERVAVESTCLDWGGSISFPESIDTFGDNLRDTRPTMFFGVPRIYTKFQLGILSKLPQKRLNLLLKIPFISNLIKSKIQRGLGLDKTRVMLVGAAPMSVSAKEWWKSIGLPISEGYGMTENLGVCTFLDGTVNKPGSIGTLYPENDLRIDPESNEIQIRCPWNMLGYYKNPIKTDEVLKNGWLHTGDQGRIDDEGYIYLTGRVKDNFKTSKGKFIIPAPIEWEFTHNSDIEQICIAGLGLPQPVALIVPSEIGAAKTKEELKCSLEDTLKEANSSLHGYQKISHVMVVKEAWSVDNQLLTPTLKVKRNKIDEKYLPILENACESHDTVLWE